MPIAVGCPLCCLIAKMVSIMVRDEIALLLSPRKLGYGVRGGAEAAVHAARSFLAKMAANYAFVKLDIQNVLTQSTMIRCWWPHVISLLTSIHLPTPPIPPLTTPVGCQVHPLSQE